MGLDVPGPGSAVFQTTFFLADQVIGSDFSAETPCPPGPRNCIQDSAAGNDRRRQHETTAQKAYQTRIVDILNCRAFRTAKMVACY